MTDSKALYTAKVFSQVFVVYNENGEAVGHGNISQDLGLKWQTWKMTEADFKCIDKCLSTLHKNGEIPQ